MNRKSNALIIGIVAIVAGIIVLIFPSILQWIIGIVLIIYGILALIGKT